MQTETILVSYFFYRYEIQETLRCYQHNIIFDKNILGIYNNNNKHIYYTPNTLIILPSNI